MNKALFLALFFTVNLSCHLEPQQKAWVVSDHYLASEVGVEVLQKGGNAIDASVATAFALAVTHPQAGNIGGGGFLVMRNADGFANTIDFREKAPLAATSAMFLDEDGDLPEDANHIGLKSVGVPGTVAGLYLAHKKYGNMEWASLVQPAIDLARKGFPMSQALVDWGQEIQGWSEDKSFVKTFFKDQSGVLLPLNALWKQPALANTLDHIRDFGHDGFYSGVVAQEIESYMQSNGGIITQKDLKAYTAIERPPLTGTFDDYEILTMSPPSSGGVALIQMMNMVEQTAMETLQPSSTAQIHFLTELMRRAFADRAEHLGDPDFNLEMPVDKLISKAHAKNRLDHLNLKQASVSDSSKYGQLYDGKHTTHFSILDKQGNAVSVTYTLEQSFGSGLGSSKLGFIFNNEMGDFNPKPGETNLVGQIGTPANRIAPEKRMLSSMTPVIVVKNHAPYLIVGSPGGRTIINTVFQTVLNVLEYNMPIDQAIEAPKIHHQWLPDTLFYEKERFSPIVLEQLRDMGHKLKEREPLGRLMGIQYLEDENTFLGASDSSSPDGKALTVKN